MARIREVWVVVIVVVIVVGLIWTRPFLILLSPVFYPDEHMTIDGDAAFTAENGVDSGSGTQADPYILEGLDLVFSHPKYPCLKVVNTTAWFVIRDSSISYRQSPEVGDVMFSGTGLQLSSSGNASVSNLTLSSCGIWVDNCTGVDVVSNAMSYGSIDVYDSSGVAISANNRTEIMMSRCGGCRISENIIVDRGIRLIGSADCLVERNVPRSSSGVSLLDSTSGCVIRWNSLSGVFVNGAYDCTIFENTVTGGGVECWLGSNITIEGNEISDCGHSHGISLQEDVADSRIIGNRVSNCYCGISLYGASGCVVYHNDIADSINHQVLDTNGEANLWDAGYPDGGNYYSEYNGSDEMSGEGQDLPGSDGIGDTPYVAYTFLSGAPAVDRYPLMQPFGSA